jgi:hypothetical protein
MSETKQQSFIVRFWAVLLVIMALVSLAVWLLAYPR